MQMPVKINAATKIAALIKADPAAIEAIASINHHFHKLRNPLLRKLLASRVTIADAARMGRTEVNVFFEKLKTLGFEVEDTVVAAAGEIIAKPKLPVVGLTLDVRETLQSGQDPLKDILHKLALVPENQSLLLVNTFTPTPLISILQKKGYAHYTEQKAPDLSYTYFYQIKPTVAEQPVQLVQEATVSFAKLFGQYKEHMVQVDVRELEMPQPMIIILEKLTTLAPHQALLVYHRRVPQYLLPQLQERGFAFSVAEPEPGQVRLLIYKPEDYEPRCS